MSLSPKAAKEPQACSPPNALAAAPGTCRSLEGSVEHILLRAQPVLTFRLHRRFTHRSVLPSSIKVGHMVEVQCGFCAIPVNRRKYRFLCKLRSVCILDRSVENVSSPSITITTRLTNICSPFFYRLVTLRLSRRQHNCPNRSLYAE